MPIVTSLRPPIIQAKYGEYSLCDHHTNLIVQMLIKATLHIEALVRGGVPTCIHTLLDDLNM